MYWRSTLGPTLPPASSSPSSASGTPPAKSKSHTGAIVGGVVGGVVVLLSIPAAIFFARRKPRRQRDEQLVREIMTLRPVPFVPLASEENSYVTMPPSAQVTSSSISSASLPKKLRPYDPATRRLNDPSTVYLDAHSAPVGPSAPETPAAQTYDHAPSVATGDDRDHDSVVDLAAVPALLGQLNSILARLPQGELGGAPPSYRD